MRKDPGPTLQSAQTIRTSGVRKTYKGFFDNGNRQDIYRFSLTGRSSLNLSLTGLKSDANVALLNGQGKTLNQSRRRGKQSEAINTVLEAGIHYIKVTRQAGKTTYNLSLSTAPTLSPDPAPPPIDSEQVKPGAGSINIGMKVRKGTTAMLGGNMLAASTRTTPNQTTYTLTNVPANGVLLLNGATLGAGGRFTQADINSGRLSYKSFPSAVQLTNNSTNEEAPKISGSRLVWSGFDGSDNEIYSFDGNTVTQLTNNTINDTDPQISGDRVTWVGQNGDKDIFYYDGKNPIRRLTNNDTDDYAPQISENGITWVGNDGSDTEIFYFNGITVAQLTNNATADTMPRISGSQIVWHGSDGSDYEVYSYNGSSVSQLTNNTTDDLYPSIFNSQIVWQGFDGSDTEIYSNGSVRQLTSNAVDDMFPVVSDQQIVWQTVDGTDSEIYRYSGGVASALTNNNVDDVLARISGDRVIWRSNNGTTAPYEIFYYDGKAVTPLTNTATNDTDPQIDGSNVAWRTSTASNSYEIFFGNVAKQDSFGFTISSGGSSSSGQFNIALV